MSQQTLSNHISRLEEHFGTKLFYRYPTLQLTPAGKDVLNFAVQIHNEETNIKSILSEKLRNDVGEITIAASSPRSLYYLPDVLKRFSDRYPNVTVNLLEKVSHKAEVLVQKNQVDFAVTIDTDVAKLKVNVKSSYSDPLYLCVSDGLLYKCYGDEMYSLREKSINGAYLENFAEIPFMIAENGRMGTRIRKCFENAGYEPKIYLKSTYTTMTTSVCALGLAGCFTSHMNLTRWGSRMGKNVNIFPLYNDGIHVSLNLYVIYNRQRYLNHHCRYFLEAIDEKFSMMGGEKVSYVSREIYDKDNL